MTQTTIQSASTFDPQHLKQAMRLWQRVTLMTLLVIAGLGAVIEWIIFLISGNAFLRTFTQTGQNAIAEASGRSGLAALILGSVGMVLTFSLGQVLWPKKEALYRAALTGIVGSPWAVIVLYGGFVYMSSDFGSYLFFFGFWGVLSGIVLLISLTVFQREKKAQDRQIASEWQEAMAEASAKQSPNGEKELPPEIKKSLQDLTDTSSAFHRRDAAIALSKLPESDGRVIAALMLAQSSDAHADVRKESGIALDAPAHHAYLQQNSEWTSKITRLVQARKEQQVSVTEG